ncbi:MAG: TIGR00282 family metallophosphoesterase [Eubacteriales bacterium]
MRILAIGDMLCPEAVDFLERGTLWDFRRREKIDCVLANAENASFLGGIRAKEAERLLQAGVDVITGGNHTMQTKDIYPLLEEGRRITRPINYPDQVPGSGYVVVPVGGCRLLVLNALGVVGMTPHTDNPVPKIRRVLEREAGRYDLAVMDFHAEATGEKLTVAHIFDGQIAMVFGTHTHVPTADEQILPGGTGYISDIGMSGPTGGVLGVLPATMMQRYQSGLPVKYEKATGPITAQGIVFEIDESRRRTTAIDRVTLT